MLDDKTSVFEENRGTLEGIAYRMLGTLADARDVVQDTYLKWQATNAGDIKNPRAWLITVCSRLALNVSQSARFKRESYVGVWLPEPFVDEHQRDIGARMELDETVSVALLLALEKLSPTERAVYLLHDVFDYPFDEIAGILEKSSASCRQLATRARKRIREDKPRFDTSPEEHQRLLGVFLQATREGDIDQLETLLTDAVELYSDGGGKVQALDDVLCGSENVAQFFIHVWQQYALDDVATRVLPQWFNGSPGMLIFEDERLTTAITLYIDAGRIRRIYAIRNPDKLAPFAN